MLFIKELKKICFSFIYVLFIGLLLFSWHENFYGVTTKEITGSQGNEVSISSGLTGGSILEKPEKNKESYGMKNKEVPDKIMCGGTDKLIMEYLANSYATYPFSYYKEVVLNENEQKEILNIIKEITGLNEQQINHLPDDYFPAVNGNVIHFGSNGTQSENGAFTFEMGNEEQPTENTDYTKQFVAQVSYEEFQELMKKAESIIGTGSNYSMENLLQYYGLAEMTYEEAMNEYEKTIYDDKVSAAFARLFCDYMTRDLGLYPVFLVVIFWLKDRRNRMNELIDCKQIGTTKLITIRFLAMLAAVLLPITILSFESLIPLIEFSAETGIAITPHSSSISSSLPMTAPGWLARWYSSWNSLGVSATGSPSFSTSWRTSSKVKGPKANGVGRSARSAAPAGRPRRLRRTRASMRMTSSSSLKGFTR